MKTLMSAASAAGTAAARAAGLLAAGLLAITAADASAKPVRMSLEQLQPTGEMQSCIKGDRIRQTKIIDNSTILFRMQTGEYYVNKLPRRCSSLKIAGGFSFDTRGDNRLCNSNTIDVIDSSGATGAFCGLGKFERMEKKADE